MHFSDSNVVRRRCEVKSQKYESESKNEMKKKIHAMHSAHTDKRMHACIQPNGVFLFEDDKKINWFIQNSQ